MRHPVDLDGDGGDELVEVLDDKILARKWTGDGFSVLAEAPTPAPFSHGRVLVGEFDDAPGLDLVVISVGDWVRLYHLDADGRPSVVDTTFPADLEQNSGAWRSAGAIGPDADGRLTIVAGYDDSVPGSQDPFNWVGYLSLWRFEGSQLVEQRLEYEPAWNGFFGCSMEGDFNGDGLQDVVCGISNYQDEEEHAHVLVLAKPDGTVDLSVHPYAGSRELTMLPVDLNVDGRTDLAVFSQYRLSTDDGLGDLVFDDDFPVELPWKTYGGDIDGDGDSEFIVAAESTLRVFQDRLASVESDEVTVHGFHFSAAGIGPHTDVNGDGIPDFPASESGTGVLLVSERI